jgi:hypothetical protein
VTTTLAAAAPAQVIRVVVVEPKKGGRLVFKGFLTAFILAVIFVAATKDDKSSQSVGMVIAFGIGATYIITNLRKCYARASSTEIQISAVAGWNWPCSPTIRSSPAATGDDYSRFLSLAFSSCSSHASKTRTYR